MESRIDDERSTRATCKSFAAAHPVASALVIEKTPCTCGLKEDGCLVGGDNTDLTGILDGRGISRRVCYCIAALQANGKPVGAVAELVENLKPILARGVSNPGRSFGMIHRADS